MKIPLATQLPIEVMAALPGYGRCYDPTAVLYPAPPSIEGLPTFCGLYVSVSYYVSPGEFDRIRAAGSAAKVISAAVRRDYPAAFNKWVKLFAPFKKRRRLTTQAGIYSACRHVELANVLNEV